MNSKVDLHIHTTFSDGTDTPEELYKKIKELGIETFAISDHDTVKGALEMENIGVQGVKFIKAVEFSCQADGLRCHILGYNYDAENELFKQALDYGTVIRQKKLEERLKYLKDKCGFEFTDEEVEKLRATKSVGKPHIANLLVEKGYADDVEQAIRKYVNPCHPKASRLPAKQAIEAITAAGGIAVWAHPIGGEKERLLTEPEFKENLKRMLDCGIKGLECYYSRYYRHQIKFLVKAAKENNLLISGGSDYHGKNKTVKLGTVQRDFIHVSPEKLTILKEL